MARFIAAQYGPVEVISIHERLVDEEGVDELKKAVEMAFKSGYAVVLDLADVPRIDAYALGTIVSLHKVAGEGGRLLALCHLKKEVACMLGVTKLETILNVCETRDEAVAALQLQC